MNSLYLLKRIDSSLANIFLLTAEQGTLSSPFCFYVITQTTTIYIKMEKVMHLNPHLDNFTTKSNCPLGSRSSILVVATEHLDSDFCPFISAQLV